jgi:hypothetical protein
VAKRRYDLVLTSTLSSAAVTARRYLKYLDAFVEKFDLLKNIRFRTGVQRMHKCPESGKWIVTVKGGWAVKPHRTYGQGKRRTGPPPSMLVTRPSELMTFQNGLMRTL